MPKTITLDTLTLRRASLSVVLDDGTPVVALTADYNIAASTGEFSQSQSRTFTPPAGSPLATKFQAWWDAIAAHLKTSEGI